MCNFIRPTADNADMRVVDINGQLLYKSKNPNFKGSFSKPSISALSAPGMYVLQLEIGVKEICTKNMVY